MKTRSVPVTKIAPDGTKYILECLACEYERYEANGWPMDCCKHVPHTCLLVIGEEQ